METSPLRFLDNDVSRILGKQVRCSQEEFARHFHSYNFENSIHIDLNIIFRNKIVDAFISITGGCGKGFQDDWFMTLPLLYPRRSTIRISRYRCYGTRLPSRNKMHKSKVNSICWFIENDMNLL